MSRRIRVRAPAKVNLTLEVLGRRADGYHEIRSLMATCDLADQVRVGAAKTLDVHTSPDVGAPRGLDLASRAARALADATGHEARAHVRIRKRIPVAAGLGGGSSDAGATLRALARLWRVDADLAEVGARVGSDVPFFARGCAVAWIGGRGEAVHELPPAEGLWIVLVTLPVRVPTAEVYAALAGRSSDGGATATAADLFARHAATGSALRALLRNDLSDAAERVCPLIHETRSIASQAGVDLALSGSGPSLFAIADDRAHALRIARALRAGGLRARPRELCVASPLQSV